MLTLSPRWLFIYFGLAFILIGSLVTFAALPGHINVAGASHSVVVGSTPRLPHFRQRGVLLCSVLWISAY